MRKYLAALATTGVLFLGSAAHGQMATEIYIPIGKSPGLSGKYTVIGRIRSIDAGNGIVTVVGVSRTWTASISKETTIWLDRTPIRMTNQKGTMADCRPGVLVEMLYRDRRPRAGGVCTWVKVQVTRRSTDGRRETPNRAAARLEQVHPLRPADTAARPYQSECAAGGRYGALETALARHDLDRQQDLLGLEADLVGAHLIGQQQLRLPPGVRCGLPDGQGNRRLAAVDPDLAVELPRRERLARRVRRVELEALRD